MIFVFIVSGLSLLAAGIALACLVTALRDPYKHAGSTEPNPILLPEFRPGDRARHPTPPFRP